MSIPKDGKPDTVTRKIWTKGTALFPKERAPFPKERVPLPKERHHSNIGDVCARNKIKTVLQNILITGNTYRSF